jgi:hypothetical protein
MSFFGDHNGMWYQLHDDAIRADREAVRSRGRWRRLHATALAELREPRRRFWHRLLRRD